MTYGQHNQTAELYFIIINPIFIQVYPHKRGWLDLPHSNSNLSNSHSPPCSIQGILFLQTNTLSLLLHLYLPHLLWSSSLPLSLHFKFECFSQRVLPLCRLHQGETKIQQSTAFIATSTFGTCLNKLPV